MPLFPAPPQTTLLFPVAGDRATAHNPADATTYFFGAFGEINPGTTATSSPLVLAAPCLVTLASIRVNVLGTLGSAGSATFNLRVNNATDYLLSAAVGFTAATQTVTVSGLSILLLAGDELQIKFLTPTWVTNPTACTYQVQLAVRGF